MTSIVLAGGAGMRLGKNKPLEVVGGRTLLQRVIDSLDPISDSILVVTGQGQPFPPVEAKGARMAFASDIYPGKGALGGIYTGLSISESSHSLVVAADMPFLKPGLLSYLMDAAAGFDVVMPRMQGLIHPLHAVYSRACLPAIREELEKGRLQIRSILPRVRVRYVEEAQIDSIDPDHLSFFNVNTPDDLEEAGRIARTLARTLVDSEGPAG